VTFTYVEHGNQKFIIKSFTHCRFGCEHQRINCSRS
jgi:hypothetical protein